MNSEEGDKNRSMEPGALVLVSIFGLGAGIAICLAPMFLLWNAPSPFAPVGVLMAFSAGVFSVAIFLGAALPRPYATLTACLLGAPSLVFALSVARGAEGPKSFFFWSALGCAVAIFYIIGARVGSIMRGPKTDPD